MNRSLRIALIVPPRGWYGRTLIDGINAYSREHGPWRFILQADTESHRVESWVRRWKPDGVLARITGPRMARQLLGLRVPVVDLLEESGRSHIPRIVCDDQEVVRRAVDHLFERHLRNFAYVGRHDTFFSRERRRCFREYVGLRQHAARAGGDGPRVTSTDILLPWESMPHLRVELADWLRGLPKPVGIVACNDVWAAQVLRVCDEYDLRVPDDIAVIGIDDDPVICQIGTPTLSSVGVNAHLIGYRAAAMLHGMIARGESPPPVTFVEPGPVQARGSTDTFAIPDADVVAAIRYLRAHACEAITPEKAAAALGMSRRTLERMLLRHVGHSPAVELTHARLDRARELLVESDASLAVVARQAGFFNPETLHRVFKKHFGVTPGAYRDAHGSKTLTASPGGSRRGRRRWSGLAVAKHS